jgi:hypothetical protein
MIIIPMLLRESRKPMICNVVNIYRVDANGTLIYTNHVSNTVFVVFNAEDPFQVISQHLFYVPQNNKTMHEVKRAYNIHDRFPCIVTIFPSYDVSFDIGAYANQEQKAAWFLTMLFVVFCCLFPSYYILVRLI